MERPRLLPTSATDETFGGVTYHLDGELVPVLTVELRPDGSVLRAPHPAVEASVGVDRRAADEGRDEAHARGHAGVRHRGVGARADRLQPRRRRPHRADPLSAGQELHVREHQFLAATDERRLHVRAREGRREHAVRRHGLLHRQVPQPQARGFSGCTATATSSRRCCAPGESIDVEPGGWLYKDPRVQMETNISRLSTRPSRRFFADAQPVHGPRARRARSRCTSTCRASRHRRVPDHRRATAFMRFATDVCMSRRRTRLPHDGCGAAGRPRSCTSRPLRCRDAHDKTSVRLGSWWRSRRSLLAAQARAADATADVPVKKVMLFSSGVGYFEHAGAVRGNGATELRFKTNQINDILKSLVLQDQDGGRVGAITYPSQDPIAKTLRELPGRHHEESEPGRSAEPAARRAASRIQSQAERLTGTILGVEARTQADGQGRADRGAGAQPARRREIRAVELQSISSLTLDDPQLQDELTQGARRRSSQARDQDKKPVTINFTGTGERRVRIGYVVETPVWKTSYRLLLDDKGTSASCRAGRSSRTRRRATGTTCRCRW